MLDKIKFLYNYFFKSPPYIFEGEEKKIETRILDDFSATPFAKNIILSTYFTTKTDPQRNVGLATDNFAYIEGFYNSVISNNYVAVIFHDSLSREFTEKYENANIKFIRCKILHYSLNDERFYIYREFLSQVTVEKILMVDVNDVTFNPSKNVFIYIRKKCFYIGRDEVSLIGTNEWIKNKLSILPNCIKQNIPSTFYTMPVVNAGVLGGDYDTISHFLKKITIIFSVIDNDRNNNMICTNIVFYDLFWRDYAKTLTFKIKNVRSKHKLRFLNLKSINRQNFNLGFPFTSCFKLFESKSEAYIYHK